jgi:hypothetical protein
MRRVRILFSLSLLLMIVGLVFVQRSVDHLWSGGTFQDRAYDWLQAIGLFLLAVSSLLIVVGTIYGSRKLASTSAGAMGAVCLGITAAFWWVVSLEGGINTHGWTLALVIPEFVWTSAGVVLLLASGVRLLLEKVRS